MKADSEYRENYAINYVITSFLRSPHSSQLIRIIQLRREENITDKKSQSQRDFAVIHPHVDIKLNTYKDEPQIKSYCTRIGSFDTRSDHAIPVNCNLFN